MMKSKKYQYRRKNQDVVYSNMNVNETKTNWGTLEQVIDDLPDGTFPSMMRHNVNEELDNKNQNNLNQENNIGIDE